MALFYINCIAKVIHLLHTEKWFYRPLIIKLYIHVLILDGIGYSSFFLLRLQLTRLTIFENALEIHLNCQPFRHFS